MKLSSKTLFFILGAAILPAALADPPYITNGPSPTEYKVWELYFFSTVNAGSTSTISQTPVVEIDYGLLPDFQFYVDMPMSYNSEQGEATTYGYGDTNLGLVYRFVTENTTRPQVSFIPLLIFPTGNTARDLGGGRFQIQLPIAIGKSWGPWTTYGNVGYDLVDHSPLLRNFPFAGWVLQRNLNQKITLGGEVFTQGASDGNTQAYTILNVGGIYNFTKKLSLQFSAGHSVIGGQHLVTYLGLYWHVS